MILTSLVVEHWKEILAFSSPAASFFAYFLGSKKRKLDISKAEAEIDKAELENVAFALKIYKETLDELREQLKIAEATHLKLEALLKREISKKERVERENEYLVSLFKNCNTSGCPHTSEGIRNQIDEIRETRLKDENK